MQGCYLCNPVLYSYGSTADQSEATEAKSLPAEICKSGGVHGESFFPSSLSLHGRFWCYEKTGKSLQEDVMLSDSITISPITIAMSDAKVHHFWEINIGSLRTKKNNLKSIKTLIWSIYRDKKSQLLGWAALGSRRPGLSFWQSLWSLSDLEQVGFLCCASIAPPVKWDQWYWFDVRSTGEKSYIKTSTIIFSPHPPKHKLWCFFSTILSNKYNSTLLTECRSGLYESISWQLFFRVIQSTGVFLRNVVFLLINFLLKDSSRQQ